MPVGEKIEVAREVQDAVDNWDCLADSVSILNCGPDVARGIIDQRELTLRAFIGDKGFVERDVRGHSGWICRFRGQRWQFISCRVALAMTDSEFALHIRDVNRHDR